jgi:hypothetical protein
VSGALSNPVTFQHGRLERGTGFDQALLPELHVTIGRDAYSSGITISAWLPSAGVYPQYSVLWYRRWMSPVLSTEEALRIVYEGVAAAIAELFGGVEDS